MVSKKLILKKLPPLSSPPLVQPFEPKIGVWLKTLSNLPESGYQKGDIWQITTLSQYTPESLFLIRGTKGWGINLFPSNFFQSFSLATPEEVEENQMVEMRKYKSSISTSPFLHTGGTTGGDPEVFVVGKDGKVIPAWTFLPPKSSISGKVEQPFWDGFQGEVCLKPNNCHAYLVDSLHLSLSNLLQMAKKAHPTLSPSLTYKCVMDVGEKELLEGLEEHVGLGCSPSQNIYNCGGLEVENPRLLPFRFAGNHIHFSLSEMEKSSPSIIQQIVELQDQITGVLSTSLLQGLEDPRRRMFYGRAGEYRLPSHGIEYRTISSSSLVHPMVAHLVYDFARIALKMAQKGMGKIWESSPDEARSIIDGLDVEGAKKVLLRNRRIVEGVIQSKYSSDPVKVKKFFEGPILSGVKEEIGLEMDENWHLSKPFGWVSHSEGKGACVNKWLLNWK